MNNTLDDLRTALFATLRGIQDGSIDLDRARAVSDLSQTIINTGKLEVEYMRQTGGVQTQFVQIAEQPRATTTGTLSRTETGTVHRMRG